MEGSGSGIKDSLLYCLPVAGFRVKREGGSRVELEGEELRLTENAELLPQLLLLHDRHWGPP